MTIAKNARALNARTLLIVAAATALGSCPAKSAELRAADMVRALAPSPTSRSLSTGAALTDPEQTAEEVFVKSVRDRGTRSLSVDEVQKLDSIVSKRKDLDVELRFDYNSAVLSGDNLAEARELGKALSDPALKDQTFLIMGHTDANGSNEFNQNLSDRRADWVKDFLAREFNVPAERLVPVGYGESHLKNANNPSASENRRVQIVNVMAHKSAKND